MTERKMVDMSENTIDNFVARMGHFQDHERGTRSLFSQTTINGHKYWGWCVLVDKDGFKNTEKRPAIQTIGEMLVTIFKDEIVEKLKVMELEGNSPNGLKLVEHFGEDLPVFGQNLPSKAFESILDDLGFGIVFNRAQDKPRIESVRIYRK